MTKFKNQLCQSAEGIKAQRATFLEECATAEQNRLIQELEDQRRALTSKMMALTDIFPDSTFSTLAAKQDFDAKTWVHDIQDLKVELATNAIELKLARETSLEWFTEEAPAEETKA